MPERNVLKESLALERKGPFTGVPWLKQVLAISVTSPVLLSANPFQNLKNESFSDFSLSFLLAREMSEDISSQT